MNQFLKTGIFPLTLMVAFTIFSWGCKKKDSNTGQATEIVRDIELNVYHTVKIGTQTWMVENLMTRTYNDGDTIPMLLKSSNNDSTPRCCWYDNNYYIHRYAYGALYNWYAIHTGKLAPKGWHVPTYSEWVTLINFLGGDSVAGGKMKSKGDLQYGTGLWWGPNIGDTNESGFSAFPAGACMAIDSICFVGGSIQGFWWSSTRELLNPWSFWVGYDEISIAKSDHWPAQMFYSVRCIKD